MIYTETIQEFKGPDWTVRVWREAKPDDRIIPQHDDDVSAIVAAQAGLHFQQVAENILALPRVNAVEVKDKAGNGCVLYASEEVVINHRRFTII